MLRLITIIVLLISTCCQSVMADGPLLPSHRIVGYYGNFNSPKMGILGEYPPEQMLNMLAIEINKWVVADPKTPVIPAIEYIAVIAQNTPGHDGKYRQRMPDHQIQKAISLASQVNGIAILDIQVGLSDVQTEISHFASYLALPHVMLALDPEFSMPSNIQPGKIIGSMDAKDVNYVINYMADIIRKNNLPPKVLIIHRFTEHMLTNYQNITPLPEVQVVIDMDGWGYESLKMDSYNEYVADELVQFTGIKLFYKEDIKKPSSGLLTTEEILKLKPVPKFILYQ